ncbi:Paramyosin [Dirofilaria immitis]|nr:Paramyosin [Dirofilaria immitis]
MYQIIIVKIDRERQRLQHEVIELTATIDQLQKDKHLAEKAAERFEAQTIELSNKVEDLNRHVNDLAQQRQLAKIIIIIVIINSDNNNGNNNNNNNNNNNDNNNNNNNIQLDNLQHVKYQLAQQLEEARRRLEDAERERSQLQAQLHQVQLELDSVRTALDEESAARAEAEHKLALANTEITQWKTKSRLQSEVEVLIVDLEKAQNTIAILERAKEQLEKTVNELKVRIDELTVELEAAQREARAALAELQKMKNLYEKAIEQKEALARENKNYKLDLENARLAGEIRELQTALKESEAARRDAENRAQRALAELQQLRIEMERRLQEKEEEMEALRKNMQFEIDRLTAALADAEARMKAEISRLKKKYQAEIAELEMTVDNLNRANIEAQKTIKNKDTQRQLQQTLDQYALAQRKVSALSAELEECKVALDNAIRARKQAEIDLEEANARITDLVSINNNLTAIKNKLETELSTAQADLDEATKELHAADERANRALADAARAVEQLHEEQEHSMKIDALRKSLEEQVKQLQVQIQEAEAAALLGGKRVIAKLETRIRDLETALDEETRRHKETQGALRKKDRRIKEVQMQVDEEHKMFVMAQDTADRLLEKLNIQKRQLGEAESLTMANLQRVRRYQRELEDAEGRADQAESSLHLIRAKHRSSVVTGKNASASKIYVLEDEQ